MWWSRDFTAEDLTVRTFSAGTAAQQVSGRASTSFFGLSGANDDPEEKEVAERRLACRTHLLEMKSRNDTDVESGGRPVIQQEDLQVNFIFFFILNIY